MHYLTNVTNYNCLLLLKTIYSVSIFYSFILLQLNEYSNKCFVSGCDVGNQKHRENSFYSWCPVSVSVYNHKKYKKLIETVWHDDSSLLLPNNTHTSIGYVYYDINNDVKNV